MSKQVKKVVDEHLLKDPTNNDNPDEYIQNLLNQLGESQATLQLCRSNNEGKFCYVDDLDPDNFSLKTIKDVYGGGRYKITIIDSSHKFIGRSKDFYIEGPTKTIPDNHDDFDYDEELSIPELSGLKREIRELKSLVSHLLNQESVMHPQRDSEDVLLDRMLKYKQLFTQNQTGSLTDNLEVLTGIFTKSLEFARNLNGPSEETPFTLLRDFLPTVTGIIENYMESKRLDNLAKLPSDQKPDDKQVKKLIDLGFKSFLIKSLDSGIPSANVCQFVVKKSSEIEKTRIKELISKDNAIDYLCKIIDRTDEKTKAYLTELVETLKKDLK